MTHAHDRTLLAKLGFADPDRRNSLHDLACQYVASPEIAEKVRAHVFGEPAQQEDLESRFAIDRKQVADRLLDTTVTLEVHIGKGQGQYATTIGFLDALLVCTREMEIVTRQRGADSWVASESPAWYKQVAVVEVKSQRVAIGDVLRQIALYQQYTMSGVGPFEGPVAIDWVLATCYPITRCDADALTAADVKHVELSPQRIQAWAAAKDADPYQAKEL